MTRYVSALVTGASSGIGEQIARVLADRGCRLTLVARRADRLGRLAEELGGRADVDVLEADLATPDGLDRVAQRLHDDPVELLVNNAGVSTGGDFHALPVDPELTEIALNVDAVVRLTHAALGPMVRAGRGGILNVSSIAGNQPLPGFATYGASKAYVTAFTEALAAEHRNTGVHVTVLKPGYVFTEMTGESAPDPGSMTARVLWLDADRVAAEAVDAVERGRLHCVPGATWKVAEMATTGLPRAVVRALSSRVRAD
jgi:short-subunit dehydrogenase